MVAEGGAVGCGVSVGPGVSVSSGVAVAEGDAPGLGEGDLFLRFRFVSGVGLGDGVGETFFRFGEAVGEGLGEDFPAERFRCFRIVVGVGVASKIFLIFVPNDSSAASATRTVPSNIATIRSHLINSRPATDLKRQNIAALQNVAVVASPKAFGVAFWSAAVVRRFS